MSGTRKKVLTFSSTLSIGNLRRAAEKYYLRNLLLSLGLHFSTRDRGLELVGGSLQELRDAATLLLHDSKAPVARGYLEELLKDVFIELSSRFLA